MRFFNLNSPLMRFLSKMADVMIVNFFTLLCCLPVFTMGAALTAAHYVCLKLVRNEECYIVRDYFKSFKQNFRQGSILGILVMLGAAVLVADYCIISDTNMKYGDILKIGLLITAVIYLMVVMFVFASQAKFDNPIRFTIKNAFLMSVLQFPKTILMIAIHVVPIVIILFVYEAIPVVLFFGISGPIFLSAFLYNKFFQRMEDNVIGEEEFEEEEDDPDRIFSDKLDEALIEENMNPQNNKSV